MKDIIDLEFLVELDEAAGEKEDLSARDRDIFRQITAPDLTDAGMLLEWLSFRKLLFFHQTDSRRQLPGDLFESLTGWAGRGLFLGGLILGLVAAYSFLAYHGTRPVNVTVFVFVFILFQALLSAAALIVMARRAAGRGRLRPALFQALISAGFFKQLDQKFKGARGLGRGGEPGRFAGMGGLMGRISREHKGLLFWPFFILSSLFALGFSCGALGGTLFRVAVTDLAFGWQSTLLTSGLQVHELVKWMALPWSWCLPQALPGLEQIEGSRIVLKEGIADLATEHLTAWWPFLCMGLLVYGIGLRLMVAGLAFRLQAGALASMDVNQPRFQRLLARMRSPKMELRIRDWQTDRGADPPPPPRPGAQGVDDQGAAAPSVGSGSMPPEDSRAGPLLVLASERVCPEPALEDFIPLVEGQLGLAAGEAVPVSFDFHRDRERLQAIAREKPGVTVAFLQEVWQPPIRGLLHYYTRIKAEVFPESRVWILLIQTPGQGDPAVPAGDVNYKVWKTAVSRLDQPELILERMLP